MRLDASVHGVALRIVTHNARRGFLAITNYKTLEMQYSVCGTVVPDVAKSRHAGEDE